MNGRIYLASPYSHPDADVREERFQAVCVAAAGLMSKGHMVFSPIAHSHCIAKAGKLPTDWTYWKRIDEVEIAASAEVWVLMLPGWHVSTGVREELAVAAKLGKPVRYVDPLTLKVGYAGCIVREPVHDAEHMRVVTDEEHAALKQSEFAQ